MSSSTTPFLRRYGTLMACLGFFFALKAGAVEQASTASAPAQCARVSVNTCGIAKALGRGINMGGMLEAPEEGAWGTRLDPAYVDVVAGRFNSVRIPVRWSNHADPDAAAAIDSFFLARVTAVVDAFLSKGMYVIIDVHHYQQLFGEKLQGKEFAVDDAVVEARFVNIWRQLGRHFKNRSDKLIFELLNEPAGRLNANAWNTLAPKALAAVRESNPERVVMIGPVDWGHPRALPSLRVPEDRNVIVTFHTYDPFNFTHQGVDYLPMKLPPGVTCCDEKQRAQIAGPIQMAHAWSAKAGYPVYLGEFGVMKVADIASRATYAKAVRGEAERLGISWAYWDFANAFGVYYPKTRDWIEPMRAALSD